MISPKSLDGEEVGVVAVIITDFPVMVLSRIERPRLARPGIGLKLDYVFLGSNWSLPRPEVRNYIHDLFTSKDCQHQGSQNPNTDPCDPKKSPDLQDRIPQAPLQVLNQSG